MNTLALDPAARCGFAHSNGESGVWQITNSRDVHPGARLERMRSLLYQAKRDWGFDRIAYEDAQLGSNNFETAGMHAELRGIVKLVASELGVETIAVNPSTLKAWATGSGRAKKPQMIRALETVHGIVVTDDNEADAIWVLKFSEQERIPERPKLQKRRVRKALSKARKLF